VFMLFFLHSLVDIFCKVATAYLLHLHFHLDILVCSYISRMARGDHENDDDDFMDPPQRNRATRRKRKRGKRKRGKETSES